MTVEAIGPTIPSLGSRPSPSAHLGGITVSDIDLKALETHFQNWKRDRAQQFTPSRAFERFAVDQVLKDLDPSDEELDAGDLGGGDDGGVDAMHIAMNQTLLVTEDTEVPKPTTSVELVIVQAKYESGFSETAVQKLQSFCNDLFDYSKDPQSLTYLNGVAREAIARFRSKYDEVIGDPHSIAITFHYVTKALVAPPYHGDKIVKRVNTLNGFVKSRLSQAKVEFEYWGCARLLSTARDIPKLERILTITKHFSDDDGSVIGLASLPDFARFLTDDSGRIRADMLEPNVRDYQGRRNPVNNDIRDTILDTAKTEEFWWLNNGITILATECSVAGNKLKMMAPEIVNGLQTSTEIFAAFSKGDVVSDGRNVLVRVIVSTDDRSRDKVIKATNFQTPVEALSLRATDRIHFDIEDRLKLYNLFYDRKKGKYKRLRKPIADIVGMKGLSQAVMAIALRKPDDARARPGNILRDEHSYGKLFDDGCNRDVYATCILLDRAVFAFLNEQDITREVRRDVRYCVDALVACRMAGTSTPSIDELAALATQCKSIDNATLQECVNLVVAAYQSLGGTDKAAKNRDLWQKVQALAWKDESSAKNN